MHLCSESCTCALTPRPGCGQPTGPALYPARVCRQTPRPTSLTFVCSAVYLASAQCNIEKWMCSPVNALNADVCEKLALSTGIYTYCVGQWPIEWLQRMYCKLTVLTVCTLVLFLSVDTCTNCNGIKHVVCFSDENGFPFSPSSLTLHHLDS